MGEGRSGKGEGRSLRMTRLAFVDDNRIAIGIADYSQMANGCFQNIQDKGNAPLFELDKRLIKVINFKSNARTCLSMLAGRLPEVGKRKRIRSKIVLDPETLRKIGVHRQLEIENALEKIPRLLLVRHRIGNKGDFVDFDHGLSSFAPPLQPSSPRQAGRLRR